MFDVKHHPLFKFCTTLKLFVIYFSEKLSQEKSYFPSYWDAASLSGIAGEECEILELHTESIEYQNVLQHFTRSMENFAITRILAVQNPRLWMTYAM